MRKRHRFEAALLVASMWAALLTGCRSGDRAYQETAKGTDGPQARQEASREPDEVAAGQPDGERGESRVLIAYFTVAENSDVDAASSASMTVVDGTARGRLTYLAQLIAQRTGGDLFSIDTATVYPGDGEKLVDYAAEEQDRDERTEIVNHIEDLEQYDTVFVGFPNMEQGFESVLCA